MGDGMEQVLNPLPGIPADQFLPHKGRMKLLDTLLRFQAEDKMGDVLVRLNADAPYFVKGIFQSHWLIEMMAQAGAVVSQKLRGAGEQDEPPIGFLISIGSFERLDSRPLVPTAVLRIRAQFDLDLDPVGHCIGSVFTDEDTLIAQSEMTFLSSNSGAI